MSCQSAPAPMPISAGYQFPSVLAISAHQCWLSV
ncbi:unnamed protein product, partial [Staurois parvus]